MDEQPTVTIRPLGRPGDLGWVVMAHGEEYAEEFGWNSEMEAMIARIVADYAARDVDGHRDRRQAGWIAELDGVRVGCIFCVATDDPSVARLRVLLVTRAGRGHGLGGRLVRECLDFAARSGYEQVTLWTNDVLTSARRIYEAAGFVLVDEEQHHSFGQDLTGQNWTLRLSTQTG